MGQRGSQFKNAKERGEWAEVRFLSRAMEQRFRVAKLWGDSAPYTNNLALAFLALVRSPSPPPQQMPRLQIPLKFVLPPPGRKPNASLPHRHHARRNDVPKIQLNNVRRHEIDLLQHMHPPLPQRHMARIRPSFRIPHRRFHLHPVRQPALFHHQVIGDGRRGKGRDRAVVGMPCGAGGRAGE